MKITLFLAFLAIGSSWAPRPGRPCTALEYTAIESLDKFEGIWYVIAHKHHKEFGKKSSIMKLEVDGEDKLKMTEYHVNKKDECHGPIKGTWTKNPPGPWPGFDIKVTEKGKKHELKQILLVEKHEHHERYDTVTLYGCADLDKIGGNCPDDKQIIAILSRYRRPSTHAMYKMVDFIRDVCLDPLSLRRLDTSSPCGNELVSSSEEASSEESSEAEPEPEGEPKAEPEPKGEAEPTSCVVPNIPGIPVTEFPLEPVKLYLVATNAPWFKHEGVRSMVWDFKGKTEGKDAEMKLMSEYTIVIHGVCYSGPATEWVDPDDPTGATYVLKLQYKGHDGKIVTWQKKEKVIYYRHGLIVSYRCDKEHPEGGCLKPIFHVWSTTEHVRRGALLHMYDKAKEHCTDPTEFVYLNTHVDCPSPIDSMKESHHHHEEGEENSCKIADIHVSPNFSLDELKGTWYLTSVTMSKRLEKMAPDFHQGSFAMKLTDGSNDNELNGQYYEDMPVGSADEEASFKGSGECKDGNGKVTLVSAQDATVKVTADISFGGKDKKFELEGKVLHVGPELLLVYNCYEQAADGKCKADKAEAALFTKSRHLRHHDRLTLYPHFAKTCIPYNKSYFLNLQSHCPMHIAEGSHSQGRLGYMALRHNDVLDIVGKSAEKKCGAGELVGQYVCLKKFAKSGPYYIHATNSPDLYGFYGKYSYEGSCSAAAGQAVATTIIDGKKQCVNVALYISHHKTQLDNGKTDHWYRLLFSSNGVDYIQTGRFIWNNYKLGVFYSCDMRLPDGTCLTPIIYLIGRHETLNHDEWKVLENLFKALCIDMKSVHHLSTHENCLHDFVMAGKKTYKVAENCDWDNFAGQPIDLDDAVGVYHDVAIALKADPGYKSHVYKTTKNGDHLKLESHMNIKDECRKYEGTIKKPGDEHNGLELKYKSKSTGKDKLLRYWFGARFGSYIALIGCNGADCGEDTGFASIANQYRTTDPIALHQTYKWFADNCIDPKWFKVLDTHTTCGANLDTRSCRVADIQAVNTDDEKANGKWFLTVTNKNIFKSVACEITSTGSTGRKAATCFATLPTKPGCQGPGMFHLTVTLDGQITCDGQPASSPMCLPGGGPTGKILYQTQDHMVSYYCLKENKDGTCNIHETFWTVFSRTPTVTKDTLPADLFEKLDQACAPTSTFVYLQETDCKPQ